ncbi:hypothetical protein SEA_TENNO_23 [Arthrobacter phage Tenno]|uniref:Minor tail protein n=1 Tax=Arthrobacter phage Tenno TaxID=2315702 RepID=A0A386KNQ3_9CAUD|nr:hypothetical protein SEA_TENNO_23 [Arthrobacter phage Tenno]
MVNTPDDPNKAQAWISGTPPDQTIDFYIPRGNTGPRGPVGPIGPSLAVGSVATVTGPAAPGTIGPQGLTGPKGDPGGIVTPTPLVAGTDWNTLLTSGLFSATGSDMAGMPNSAPSMAIGVNIMVQARSASVVTQLVWTVSNAHSQIQFQRSFVSGTWGPWKVYRNTNIDNSVGRVITLWDETGNRSQMFYGDTGQRNISASVTDASGGTLYLRRIGHMVSLAMANLQFTDTASGTLHSYTGLIPTGFWPAVSSRFMLAQSMNTNGIMTVNSNGDATLIKGTTNSLYHELMWTTTQPWPTALPGTASGGIPNI